jgi:phosphoenolpyruvate carboxylase
MAGKQYREIVENRFLIFNSLFLNLPFEDIYETGTLLPLFGQHCRKKFAEGMYPLEIVNSFFEEFQPDVKAEEKRDLLFRLIQYVERQVVLFDSVEDATFEKINDGIGKGSLSQLIAGVSAEGREGDLLEELNNFGLRIVLTAHPTQFYPGNVLAIITDLEQAIRDNDLQDIDLILQQLGKTPFINRSKPTPYDEAVSLCWYLENVFYQVIPEIIEEIDALASSNGIEFTNHQLIRVGFWPGGDRDGNPYVTHETTLRVARRLKETALKCYYRDIRQVRRRITFKGVEEILLQIEKKIFTGVYGEPDEGYRQFEEMEQDLNLARKVLVERHQSLFLNLLDSFILKTRIFKFHMAPMDLRQDSRKHAELWEQLTGESIDQYSHPDISKEIELLESMVEIKLNTHSSKLSDPFYKEMLETFKIIPNLQRQNGETGCCRYIISNSMRASDVMLVYSLAKEVFNSTTPPLDVIPLFESIEDLADSPKVMETLYRTKIYREHLESRKNRQTIMLGFSDGTKDGGYLQANYSIFKAKEELTQISRQHGIEVIFFDGRGGPPSRGGGNTHAFYSSLGPGIESGEIQLTIQGQTISSNFGNAVSCRFNLEQLLTSTLENAVHPQRQIAIEEHQKILLEEMASESRKAYVSLKEHQAFVKYLEQATPLRFFGKTNIGSRPVKRSGDKPFAFEDLRAIPFVGSWAQMKQNVPGFFGLGTAIGKMANQGRLQDIRDLYQNSPFFRALIGNSMQSIAKSFYPATAYLRDHPQFGEFLDLIRGEFELTKKWLPEIAGQRQLLEDNPVSRKSIEIRERIILPVIAIQQYALQQLLMDDDKLTDPQKASLQNLVLRCMYGIINAARNAA